MLGRLMVRSPNGAMMAGYKERDMYKNIHAPGPAGRLLFRYDPQRHLIEIKADGLGWIVVDL